MYQRVSLTQLLIYYGYGLCQWRASYETSVPWPQTHVAAPNQGPADKHTNHIHPPKGGSRPGDMPGPYGVRTVSCCGVHCAHPTERCHVSDLNSPTGSGPRVGGILSGGPLTGCHPPETTQGT
jgi:hypothetical protein